ncbi:MDR family MFS transporter [Ancylobacter amanitiformis]|uniref:EmrB/QacA subfamily drug resistance transporter n=1 Tax=Ancylobacter amanitiformis TaxID=217069 RepID=A0ABU0LPN1_9HYPH|nr:MDR family MFS transporter [Ancylobacter amanitiformis]MDQ0510668.1 EmrB/QacA subfamily drug resistance transporter [Ancylobacter amanitiformis]
MDAHSPTADYQLAHAEIRTIIIGVMLAMFLSALDQTIIATALPTIGAQFGDLESISWVVTAYLLTGTAVTPLVGKLADIHGPRPVLLASIALFLIGSVLCALAPGMMWMIAGRAVQGLGGGGLIALAQTIIGLLVAPRERGRYQAYFAAVFITSSIAGPILGGFFAEHLHWSLIFWINVPLGIGAAAMSDRALRRLPAHHHPHRLDILGAGLMCVATVLLLLALTWGGTRFAWASAPIITLLAGSAVVWAGFAVRVVTAAEPLLPVAVLSNQVVRTGVPAAAFAMGTLIGLSIQLPLYLEGVLRLSASASGMALIPLMGGVVVGATGAGRMMSRAVHYKRLSFVGLLAAIAALLILAVWPIGLHVFTVCAAMGVVGIGLGTVLPVSTVAIQNAVPLPQMGTATGVVNFFRSLGGAVLTAGFGAIVIGMSGIEGGSLLEALLAGETRVGPLAGAFRWVFAAAAAALSISLVALLLMEERPLRSGHAPAPTLTE